MTYIVHTIINVFKAKIIQKKKSMSTKYLRKKDFISSYNHVFEIGIVIKFINVVG